MSFTVMFFPLMGEVSLSVERKAESDDGFLVVSCFSVWD